ncbi:MAG: 8-amino-7-oxononanoate synthase [Verrucomicrobiota bacterium]|jgi:8-amino-7-oxononanoate synthase|nr:8-amino-7-oxononanoate synthase [Verrucomicrobiota bacterium]MDP7178164.1 8-amino-7-oxononanoate synthase [Verrucomicrobiota bacterium]
MAGFNEQLGRDLDEIRGAGLWRELREIASAQSTRIKLGGREFINFSSNDYLGLAAHPALTQAAQEALDRFGTGSGASRLICGSLQPHHELEAALAKWQSTEAALVFSTGFAAVQGVLTSLLGQGDVIILDKKAHASMIDAAKLSGATLRIFHHNNLGNLEKLLQWAVGQGGRVLVGTESVFSMDGDRAPLAGIVELKERYGAWLMLDEAHAFGLYGPLGQGLAAADGLAGRIEIRMGTLGKAVGAAGGFICGSRQLVDLLVNRARSFIFSTAPSPAVSAAARAGVELIQGAEGESLRGQLWQRVEELMRGIESLGWKTPVEPSAILPLIIGAEEKALAAMEQLRETGLFIPAIRHPTVSRNEARLRVTLSSSHTGADVRALLDALGQAR